VTTRTRGIADHLRDGENAIFVPPREPQVLAAALEKVVRDEVLRERMGRANKRKVKEFAPDRVAGEYLAALRTIVRSRPGEGLHGLPPG
jgi:glycosyltransferase involved in cell wall biosynthesis